MQQIPAFYSIMKWMCSSFSTFDVCPSFSASSSLPPTTKLFGTESAPQGLTCQNTLLAKLDFLLLWECGGPEWKNCIVLIVPVFILFQSPKKHYDSALIYDVCCGPCWCVCESSICSGCSRCCVTVWVHSLEHTFFQSGVLQQLSHLGFFLNMCLQGWVVCLIRDVMD